MCANNSEGISSVEVTLLEYDDTRLIELLIEFELLPVYDYLKAAKVSYDSLQYMKQDDIKEAIPPLGLRMEFREKFFKWKKGLAIDDDTISLQSNVDNWVIEKEDFNSKQVLNKSLVNILKESLRGRSIIAYEKKNKNLTIDHRNCLIKIIVEEAISNQVQIKIQDFPLLINEICWVFPSERNVQDYYFIPRGNKGSASGKLYSKYKNCRAKRLKCYDLVSSHEEHGESENTFHCPIIEIDESIGTALKTTLNRDSTDWADVCEKWKQTFQIRRRDVLQLNSVDFFESWSKLSHAKAADLIEIDFDVLYPGKCHMLFSKWEEFKTKILTYYESNIVNEVCKQQMSKAKVTENKDSQDSLITILLNSIFPSSARFKNSDGKKTKKVTIADSQESFVLHLTTLNDYRRKIEEILCKYYSAGLTVQPFLILEGSESDVHGFYVYFDKNLIKFDSFIKSLDICFKIFHILSLKYPVACEQSWLFIQKYFFKIDTEFDSKSSNVTAVINYLK